MPWLQQFTLAVGSSGPEAGYVERDGSGTPLGVRIGNTDYVYVTDGLGSVVNMLDTTGASVAWYTYDPYGVLLSATGSRAASNPIQITAAPGSPSWARAGTPRPKAQAQTVIFVGVAALSAVAALVSAGTILSAPDGVFFGALSAPAAITGLSSGTIAYFACD